MRATLNFYRLKRAIVAPYVWLMRREFAPENEIVRSFLEAQYYRPTMFRWMLHVASEEDPCYEVALDSSSLVIDAGAFNGDWSARIVDKYDPHVFMFEPNPECAAWLSNRFSGNPKVRCFDYGVYDRDASLPFIQSGPGSSLFDESDAKAVPSARVRVRDIVRVLDEVGCPDLLKLNIEGGEYEVLERLIECDRLRSIPCVLVQFHEWRDGAHRRRRRIRRALGISHDLAWDYPFIWEKWVRR